jgi:hypothetical protein
MEISLGNKAPRFKVLFCGGLSLASLSIRVLTIRSSSNLRGKILRTNHFLGFQNKIRLKLKLKIF